MGKIRVTSWLLFLSFSSYAGPNLSIEAFGDSLTAGLISHTQLTAPPPLKELGGILSSLALFKVTKNYDYLQELQRPNLAWVAHIAKRLADLGYETKIENHSVSGAQSVDLARQVRESRAQPTAPADHGTAFFFVGHNDLCNTDDSPTALANRMESSYREALRHWNERHRNSQAFIIPVSEMQRLYPALAEYVWLEAGTSKYSCSTSWATLFPMCKHLYRKYTQGKLSEYLTPRIQAVNSKLRALAEGGTSGLTSENSLHYVDVHDVPFGPEHFAIDCFHLSSVGQTKLGEAVFQQIAAAF